MPRDVIAIRDLEIDCVVGIHPSERDAPQRLRVDVELGLDTEEAGVSERLSRSVDYEHAAAQIAFLLQSCRFQLLETAAHALARYLLAPPARDVRRAPVETLRLRLTKPDALGGAATPSLTIERDASWVRLRHEDKAFGSVDVIHEAREAGIYRLQIAPGRRIPLHIHRRMAESEMVLGDGMLCQGRAVPRGTVHRWPLEAAHEYRNPTSSYQSILCVDSPRFEEDDEIPVQGEPAAVAAEPVVFRQACT